MIGYLVRADGSVAKTVVLNSSGSRALDSETATALSKCKFPSTGERWARVVYTYSFEDDPDLLGAKRNALLAAKRGNLPARYNLSLLMLKTAKTHTERVQALAMLHSAAELGHAHAQFDLGQRYEQGTLLEADLPEALRWYEKSAAQGDPLAKHRLATSTP